MKIRGSIRRRKKALVSELGRLGDVLFGSLIERKVKCGKAGCRCMREVGYRHGPLYYLSDKRRGKTRWVYVQQREVGQVQQRLWRGQRAGEILKELGELSRQELGLGQKRRKKR